MNSELLLADLTDQEGFRAVLYDDATGKKITKGSLVQGNPTVAIGWNVAGRPCPRDLANIITQYFITQTWGEVTHALPWAANLPEPQSRALCNLAYNMGVPTLLTFKTFLSLMQLGHYSQAADDLAGTLWFKQVGSRGPKIQALIKTGIA
jgi:lysozyme